MEYRLTKSIPLIEDYDVLVAGGGPAGCAAAIAAARNGAKVLLLEQTFMLGGAATAGLVNAWTPFSDGIRVTYGGIAQEVFRRTKAQMYHIPKDALNWVSIDPEALKSVYDRMAAEAGVHVLFGSSLTGVELEAPGTVGCLLVSNKAGLTAYKARIYIDATGDGDLCAWAGAKWVLGDGQGNTQPATHCFQLSNVDEYGYRRGGKMTLHPQNPDSPIHKIVEDPKYGIADKHICASFIGPGTMGFNAGHLWGIDATDPESLSAAVVQGRAQASAFRDALGAYFPRAFADAFLTQTAPHMGIRESRRILGDYVFTLEDYLNRSTFPDEICRNHYFVDVHPTPAEAADRSGWHSDDRYEKYRPGESHGIPYRCLTPKGLTNVLTAGRCLSCDHASQGSLRVMPACLTTGEAAGIGAALALREKTIDVHKPPIREIRKLLRENGAYLPETQEETI